MLKFMQGLIWQLLDEFVMQFKEEFSSHICVRGMRWRVNLLRRGCHGGSVCPQTQVFSLTARLHHPTWAPGPAPPPDLQHCHDQHLHHRLPKVGGGVGVCNQQPVTAPDQTSLCCVCFGNKSAHSLTAHMQDL